MRGIAPGAYKIFAWEALEPNAYFDPQILRQYEEQGKAIRMVEGGKITAEVKMIPTQQGGSSYLRLRSRWIAKVAGMRGRIYRSVVG